MEEESTIHVLRDCLFAVWIWMNKVKQADLNNCFNLSLQDWLPSNLYGKKKGDGSAQWALNFGVTCWVLWNWRNRRLFDRDFQESNSPLSFIRFKIMQIKEAEKLEERNGLKKAKEWKLIG